MDRDTHNFHYGWAWFHPSVWGSLGLPWFLNASHPSLFLLKLRLPSCFLQFPHCHVGKNTLAPRITRNSWKQPELKNRSIHFPLNSQDWSLQSLLMTVKSRSFMFHIPLIDISIHIHSWLSFPFKASDPYEIPLNPYLFHWLPFGVIKHGFLENGP